MADIMIPINTTFDFNVGTSLQKFGSVMVVGDKNAHKISVTCKRGSVAADISTMTCSGTLINKNKHTVPALGTIIGNVATLEIPASWYAVAGPALLLVQLSNAAGTTTTTIYDAYTTVQDGATDVFYDPESIIASFAEIAASLVGSTPGTTGGSQTDPLDGKVLVHLGDSISAGMGIDADPETGVIPTFPVVAGGWHNMTVHNLAISGAWMVNGMYHGTATPYPLVSMIDDAGFLPDAIDIITIMIGGNDEYGLEGLYDEYCLANYGDLYMNCTTAQQKAAQTAISIADYIGTPSDTADSTWWGCWNIVFAYLRTNYPEATIALMTPLLSDPVNDPYQAELRSSLYDIAKKYGCPIKDVNNSNEWFSWGWTDGIGTAEATALKDLWTIDSVHPNAAAHAKAAEKYNGWLMSGFAGSDALPHNEIMGLFPYRGVTQGPLETRAEIAKEISGLSVGRDLSVIFPTFAAVMSKLADGSFNGIKVGDYWPDIPLPGVYRNYTLESCPTGVTYYSDTALTTSVDVTTETVNAAYVNETYCSIVIGGTTYYVSTSACNGYCEDTLSTATFRAQFAALQNYPELIDQNHAVMCGVLTFFNGMAMRKSGAVWEDASALNPWLGSALYRTLNDPDYGIIRLFDSTIFSEYIYTGESNDGMSFPLERKPTGNWNADNVVLDGRGILFLPLEHEVFGSHLFSSSPYGCGVARQWDLFKTGDTRRKIGDGSAEHIVWYTASAQDGTPYGFCAVSPEGFPTVVGDNTYWCRFPICFIATTNIDTLTQFLLHFDGANGSTVFVDSSSYGHTITPTGDAEISTAQSVFGGSSAYFDGSGDNLALGNVAIGTQAFTLDFRVRVTAGDRNNVAVSLGGGNEAPTSGFILTMNYNYAPYNYVLLYAGDTRIQHTSPLPANEWHHIALVGDGGADGARNLKLYLDGTQVGSTYTVDYNYPSKPLLLGVDEDTPDDCLLGYIDEFRLRVGEAVWSGNFTPPAAAY